MQGKGKARKIVSERERAERSREEERRRDSVEKCEYEERVQKMSKDDTKA